MGHETRDKRSAEDPAAGRDVIAGRVLNEWGQPIRGLTIIAHLRRPLAPNEEFGAFNQGELEEITDYDGGFRFEALVEGQYQIRTSDSERYAQARSLVWSGTHSVDLIVAEHHEVWIHGVVENERGEPLADVHVMPIGQPSAVTHTDEAGGYGVSLRVNRRVPANSIRFTRQDYRIEQLDLQEAELDGEDLAVHLQMKPLNGVATVSGRITDMNGAPVSGETVQLRSNGSQRRYQATSDAQGHFMIRNIEPAANYLVAVQPSVLYKDYRQTGLDLRAGAGLNLSIELERADHGRLVGTVLDAAGNPVPRFPLHLRSFSAYRQSTQFLSNDQGDYFVEEIPRGPLIIESLGSPYLSIHGVRPLESDATLPVDLTLGIGNRALDGQVTDSTGQPVPMASVVLSWSLRENGVTSQATHRSLTDEWGSFRFTRVSGGMHTLKVSSPGFRNAERQLNPGDSNGRVTVTLEPESDVDA